jgi:hypothetical protein
VFEIFDVLRQCFVGGRGDQGQQWVENLAHWCIVGCCDAEAGYTFVLPRWEQNERLEGGSRTQDAETAFERLLQVPQIEKMWGSDEQVGGRHGVRKGKRYEPSAKRI